MVEHVQDNPAHKDLGLQSAAAEAWLFSLADAHVISQDSSFGRLGALLSGQWGGVYELYPLDSDLGYDKSCKPRELLQLADTWVGVR